jgi:curved DNA-binding protein CbpA
MSTRDEDLERLRSWAAVIDDSNYYEILGVLELADTAAIQAAFHEFALAFHPDVHQGGAAERLDVARAVFRRGAEAYRVLSDADLRAKYDLALARGYLRLTEDAAGARSSAGSPGRTKDALKSLEDLCRSPAARLSAHKADTFIGQGQLAEARRLLKQALGQDDYDNPELEERIEALDLALFAMGQ